MIFFRALVCVALAGSWAGLRGVGGQFGFVPQLVDGIEDLVQKVHELPLGYDLQDNEEFEYIVVGAGAAGSAVAARLALGGADVLLVEAGGDPSPLTKIPYASQGLLGSSNDWKYPTLPNNVSCLSSIGQACRFSRGKALGGSSSINYMMYVRGNPADYEYGIPGWTWEEFRPYFLRYEGLRSTLPDSSASYHNTSGILEVQYFADPQSEWPQRIRDGFAELKVPFNEDINAQTQIGVTRVLGYTYKGQRMSTARGYLAQDDVKDKLKVAKGTRCTGVVLDGNNAAVGITVVRDSGRKLTLRASKEVILSAGAIGTPQILMLSGIGPADHLKEMGIDVRADQPVGDDFSDHVLPLLFLTVDRKVLKATGALVSAAAQAVRWAATHDGVFASNGLSDTTVLLNTRCYDNATRALRSDDADCQLPTLQVIHAYVDRGLLPLGRSLITKSTNLNDHVTKQLASANAKSALMVVSPVVLSPASRGTLRLASADPLAPPAILPNFLGEEADVDEMIRAINILQDLTATKPYVERNAQLLTLSLDGCPEPSAGEAYWRCYVRHLTFSVFHSTGTAALGRALDACLRVRGVTRLRVADLSALPRVPRGNTEAAAIALGERLADFLANGCSYASPLAATPLTD